MRVMPALTRLSLQMKEWGYHHQSCVGLGYLRTADRNVECPAVGYSPPTNPQVGCVDRDVGEECCSAEKVKWDRNFHPETPHQTRSNCQKGLLS